MNLIEFMRKQTLLAASVLLIILVILTYWRIAYSLDPDLGWHLRMGDIILTHHHIPPTDLLSYTMPSYAYVDHEWLTDVILVSLFRYIHVWGLAVISTMIVILTLLIACVGRGQKAIRLPVLLSLFLGLANLYPFLGIRPQLLSWLFFSILYQILAHWGKYKKYMFFLPLFFLIWANLHGGFAIGILLLMIYTVDAYKKEHVSVFSGICLVVLCTLATCINPYGYRIWLEIINLLTDTYVHARIVEWMPVYAFFTPVFLCFVALSGMLLFTYHKSLDMTQKVVYCVLLLLAVGSVKNVPFWIIVATPLTRELLSKLSQESLGFPHGERRFQLSVGVFFLISIVAFLPHVWRSTDVSYPTDAVSYLQKHPFKGHLFSLYNWGGYLLWYYPQKKVFIDGRMADWHTRTAPPAESADAFKDYTAILTGTTPLADMMKRYNITTFLLPVSLLHLPQRNKNNFTKELRKMKVIYQDDTAVIIQK